MVIAVVCCLCLAFVAFQQSEITFLRGQLVAKQEHDRRVERVASGLPEVAPEPEKLDVPPQHIQLEIDRLIGMWESTENQSYRLEGVKQWRKEGREWPWIVAELRSDLEE